MPEKEPKAHHDLQRSVLKRSFLCESDDLVDELLAAIKKHGWTDLKLKYEMGDLSASRSVKVAAGCDDLLQSGSRPSNAQAAIAGIDESKYTLTASWEEQAEEVELTITVEGDDASSGHTGAALAEQVISALFAESTYRHVIAQDDA